MFLYEKLETLKEIGALEPIPQFLKNNLSNRIELRDYQVNAFQNFITYYNSDGLRKNKQVHVLFHMATGSGKTPMMAGLILYLYKQGYRNFLFFVNITNIIEKTKDNFLNPLSPKYLFSDSIEIDGDIISIREVNNFQNVNDNCINLCFSTTQKLHGDLTFPKENGLTLSDFEDKKIVLISDESHHVNTLTKKSNIDKDSENNWEYSVNQVLASNRNNILLEFTATCDLKDTNVLLKYNDKIIFDYPLAKFRSSKYTKDFRNMQSDYNLWERTLIALILSQYRLKLFSDIKQPTKPVILLKSQRIAESESFYKYFLERLNTLTSYEISSLDTGNNPTLSNCFTYMKKNGISYEMLAEEIKLAFSEEHCIIMNGNTDNSIEKQFAVNTLESPLNPYRLVFTVDMLNEGWDVLNLFDIVRLYETRQSSGHKISPYTIKEAQLIGRGARYCPFITCTGQERYKRKYDDDFTNEMRICETMYYHSIDDSRYINELRNALKEIGLLPPSKTEVEYVLKEDFKSEDIYKTGFVFSNNRIVKDCNDVTKIDGKIRSLVISFSTSTGSTSIYDLFEDSKYKSEAYKYKSSIEMKNIPYSISFCAICNFESLKFNLLKKHFPNLTGMREFLISDDYLGNITINITSIHNPASGIELYLACKEVFLQVSQYISNIEINYKGTNEFQAKRLHSILKNKTRYIEDPHGDGEGISQKLVSLDIQLDLSTCDWYVYNDNYGTPEEKKFVHYFSHIVNELKQEYNKVYLIRNERFPELAIYDFDTGERFEPDYLLILQKTNKDYYEQQQIYVEPKGTGYMQPDSWKEEFLLKLEQQAIPVKTYADDYTYKIVGLPFYNSTESNDIFFTAMKKLYKT